MTDDTRDVIDAVKRCQHYIKHDHPSAEEWAKEFIAALAAKGLVIADKDDVLWLRALRAAGVDNWQGIEHAIDLRAEMEADDG